MTGHLTLSRTRLPGAGPDDYAVLLDGKIIGRIYKTPNRTQDVWFWGLNSFPSSAENSGFAADFEAAKKSLKTRLDAI